MSRRTERIQEAIRRLASEILHGGLRDPRISGFVTITKVEVTPNLRLAKIYYSILGGEKEKKRVHGGLKSAKNFIRKHIADELKLRYAPDILFRFDKGLEKQHQIDDILSRIKKEEEDDTDRKNSKSD